MLVYTNNDQYSSGECIQGHVLVNIIIPTKYSGLFVKLSAKERVRFDEQEAYQVPVTETYSEDCRQQTRISTRTEYRTVTRFGTNVIFKTEIMVMGGGDLVTGQFSVPFSFQLPTGLPGSFALAAFEFDCGIDYKVKAKMKIPGMLKSNLRSVRTFEVLQSPPPFTQTIMGTNGSQISVCCCFNRGFAQLEFKCTKDSFQSGEMVSLVASATNNSTADLKRLTVKLRRSVQIHDNLGHSKVIEATIAEAIYPGVAPNSSVCDVPMTLQIPPDAPQQCFGFLIRCLYSVRLAGKVKCGNDATCTVPAFIYRPPVMTAFTPPKEATWNPTVYNPVQIGFQTQPNIPQPVSLSQFPGSETMKPSAPMEVPNVPPPQYVIPENTEPQKHPPTGVSLEAQPGLDSGFLGR